MYRKLQRVMACAAVSAAVAVMPVMRVPVYGAIAVKGTVTARSGFVRQAASTSSSCVFCVSKDEEVLILSEKKGTDGKVWYQIQVGSSIGYIRSDLASKSQTKVTVPDSAVSQAAVPDNTVLQATVSGNMLTQALSANAQVQAAAGAVTDMTAAANLTGAAATVEKEQTEAQTQSAVSASIQVGTVRGTGVNVRENPVTGTVTAHVSTGQPVTVTGFSRGDDGNIWCRISFIYNKMPANGYIRSDFLSGITLDDSTG